MCRQEGVLLPRLRRLGREPRGKQSPGGISLGPPGPDGVPEAGPKLRGQPNPEKGTDGRAPTLAPGAGACAGHDAISTRGARKRRQSPDPTAICEE